MSWWQQLGATLRSERGLTLVEMITVITVTFLLSALIIANTVVGDRRQELRDAAYDFVNIAHNAESRASSGQPVSGETREAYGICVTSTEARNFPSSQCEPAGVNPPNAYQLYARAEDDPDLGEFPDDPIVLQSVELPDDYIFNNESFYLDFTPPQGNLLVNGASEQDTLRIRYQPSGCAGGPDCRNINFRPAAGAVYVQ